MVDVVKRSGKGQILKAVPSKFANGKWSRLPEVLELSTWQSGHSLKRKTTDKDYSRFGRENQSTVVDT